jgi:hypothetical protein
VYSPIISNSKAIGKEGLGEFSFTVFDTSIHLGYPEIRTCGAGAGQGPELISPGRQGAINELFSRTGVFEIICVGIPLTLYAYRLPLTVSKLSAGIPRLRSGIFGCC